MPLTAACDPDKIQAYTDACTAFNVPDRKLTFDPTFDAPGDKAAFRLEQSGPISEGEIERELLPYVYRFHPALEDETGRLKQQLGVHELMSQGPEFFLTPPDERGVSHFGGLRLPHGIKAAFLAELLAAGWVIEQ